jgi:hypothetical protein
LQSILAVRLPSWLKAIVYFALSSGVSVVSSLPWNLTSRQDVPPRLGGAPGGGA